MLSILILVGNSLVLPESAGFRIPERYQDSGDARALKQALNRLASDNGTEREAAQATLLGFGQKSIPPLLDLLTSLTPQVKVCPPNSNLPCEMVTFLIESDSRRRLRTDVIFLIGHLHAVEAVPLLVKTLGLQDSEGAGLRYWGPEKSALIEIGALAVPELMDNLMLAENYRRSIMKGDHQGSAYSELEVRIIEILGDIGDQRSLLFLEEMKKNTTNQILDEYLKEAIETIKHMTQKKG